jgi:hypothetical protein
LSPGELKRSSARVIVFAFALLWYERVVPTRRRIADAVTSVPLAIIGKRPPVGREQSPVRSKRSAVRRRRSRTRPAPPVVSYLEGSKPPPLEPESGERGALGTGSTVSDSETGEESALRGASALPEPITGDEGQLMVGRISPSPSESARPRAPQVSPLRRASRFVVPAASVVIEILAFHHDDPTQISNLGLISETPRLVYVLGFALSLSFAVSLRSRTLDNTRLLAHLFALALLLPGLPGFLEQYPRFSTAWLHVGFVQAIIVHKHPITGLDARFSWPGFFTGIASIVGMAHLGTALPLLRWTPLVLNLAYALPIYIIARVFLESGRKAWLVTWLFILANWVGQDYFSPQGMAYFIFLSCLAIVLVGFRRVGRPVGDRALRGFLTRLARPLPLNTTVTLTYAQQTGMLVLAMLAAAALSMEHQLTPIALGVDLVALTLAKQTRTAFFSAAVIISVVVWICYGASSFWQGHLLSTLFGSGGTAAVQATVTNRITGSLGHEIVVYERILFALGVWALAGLAALRGFLKRSPVPLGAVVLAMGPFVMLAVQSYGGEAALRVYLYTLPFMLILVVAGLADRFPARSVITTATIVLVSTLVVPLLLIARFGNERFEQVTGGDVAAARYVYSVAQPGASIGAVSPNALLGFHDLAAYDYPPNNEPTGFAFTKPAQVLRGLGHNARGVYLLITPAQIENGVVNDGLPDDWGARLEARLAKNRRFKLLFNRFGGRVYKVEIAP